MALMLSSISLLERPYQAGGKRLGVEQYEAVRQQLRMEPRDALFDGR